MNGVGLLNRGNTCYLNSALQLLGLVDGLHKYIEAGKWEKDLADLDVLYKNDNQKTEIMKIVRWWTQLQLRMHSHKNEEGKKLVADPTVMRVWMGTKGQEWLALHQQDSQEALGYIIDLFAEYMGLAIDVELEIPEKLSCDKIELELHKKAWKSWVENYGKKYSIWTELFFGQEHILGLCGECNHRNDQFDPFLFTFLNVDCLKEQHTDFEGQPLWKRPFISKFRKDPPQEDYKCDNCKMVGKTCRGLKWWRAPYYMLTVWKSFVGENVAMAAPEIILPKAGEELDFSEWVEYENKKIRYKLLGWVNHLGNLSGGHYRMVRMPSEEWGEGHVVIDDDVLAGGSPENKYPGRAYMGLWKRVDTSIEESDYWQVS